MLLKSEQESQPQAQINGVRIRIISDEELEARLNKPLPATKQKSKEEVDYAKIKEFTGVEDITIIRNAICMCKNKEGTYELTDVVNCLISDPTVKTASLPSTTRTVVPVTRSTTVGSNVVSKPKVQTPTTVSTGTSTTTAATMTTSTTKQQAPPATTGQAAGTGVQETTKTTGQAGVQTGTAAAGGSSAADAVGGQAVIDLTNESEDDIQKAIQASLQDTPGILGGQVTREEQDISRILEASILESKVGTKRKRGDLWFVDPLNPHERKRKEDWPVGLKNVGNTCWFSAVIQSLFHLPAFRSLVLSFTPPPDLSADNSAEHRNLLFMQELRHLFSLMVGTKRKYVDPSRAVEILKEALSSGGGGGDSQQQDVSEFQHKLREWLEDAFKADRSRPPTPEQSTSTGGSPEKKYSNPMVELFYGQFKAEGYNEGNSFTNTETFGQFPLQVNGFRDIHESLEAATAQGEIETVSSDVTSKSGQEQWFTRLPPVLTFELSRFQFNQQLGRPEKIHNKLEFPQQIYMDRYMECNTSITRQRREEVKRLREELLQLQSRLDKFINYGSGPKRFPIQDVLQYALEFARSKPTTPTISVSGEVPAAGQQQQQQQQDVEMDSPRSHTSMQTDSPAPSPAKTAPPDITMNTPGKSPAPSTHSAKNFPIVSPTPRHVAPEELTVLQGCLHRWRTEVEADVKELQDSINQLDHTVTNMYNDEKMKRFLYRLHAVLVHEGQAASGHYWAYVYDPAYKRWLKFNDITVTEASWDELVKESVGGYHNASAYCLMYVDASRKDLVEGSGEVTPGKRFDLDCLPKELRQNVMDDNTKFAIEIEDWDRDHSKNTTPEFKNAGEGDVTIIGDSKASHNVSTQTQPPKITLAMLHAQVSHKDTVRVVQKAVESESFIKSPDAALLEYCNMELKRCEELSKSCTKNSLSPDHRLSHIVVYLYSNAAPLKHVTHRIMLEQFTVLPVLDTDPRARKIREAAINRLHSMTKNNEEAEDKLYKHWHEDYSIFRKMVLCFVLGVEAFHKEHYQECLPYLVQACEMNKQLLLSGHPNKGLDSRLLAHYRRQCLLHLNEMACSQFEADDDVTEALGMMSDLVLPCLPLLNSQNSFQDDESAMEEIREKWCAFLGQEIPSEKVEKLQDFLSKLFEPGGECGTIRSPPLSSRDQTELIKRYANVMELASKNDYLEGAATSK